MLGLPDRDPEPLPKTAEEAANYVDPHGRLHRAVNAAVHGAARRAGRKPKGINERLAPKLKSIGVELSVNRKLDKARKRSRARHMDAISGMKHIGVHLHVQAEIPRAPALSVGPPLRLLHGCVGRVLSAAAIKRVYCEVAPNTAADWDGAIDRALAFDRFVRRNRAWVGAIVEGNTP